MENLTNTQQFYLCAINSKGKLPVLNGLGVAVGMVVSEIMELAAMGVVVRDKSDKLLAVKQYDGGLSYLQPIYETIMNYKGAIDITDLSDMYAATLRMPGNSVGKSIDDLILPIGKSLADVGCANELPKNGLLRGKPRYAPKVEIAHQIIEKIRSAFLSEGEVTNEALCFTAMLCESGVIAEYFNKDEVAILEARIKEARESETHSAVRELLYYIDCVAGIASKLDFGGC